MKFLLLLIVPILVVRGQHHYQRQPPPRHYKVRDDAEEGASPTVVAAAPAADYSNYYSGAETAAQASEDGNTGFVQPIDFSSFFRDAGGAASTNNAFKVNTGFFKPAPTEFQTGVFSKEASTGFGELLGSATKNKDDDSGFVDANMQFRSLFDSSNAETGFRPEDFLKAFPSAVVTSSDDDKNTESGKHVTSDTSVRPGPHYNHHTALPPTSSYQLAEPHQGKSSYYAPTGPGKKGYAYYPRTASPSEYSLSNRAPPPAGFNPSASYSESDYESAPAPSSSSQYNPSGTVNKNHKCKKIEKTVKSDDVAKGRFRRQAMTCYVCEDPKNGGAYENCAYGSEAPVKGYFVAREESYSTNTKPYTYRYRRYLDDPDKILRDEDDDEDEEDDDDDDDDDKDNGGDDKSSKNGANGDGKKEEVDKSVDKNGKSDKKPEKIQDSSKPKSRKVRSRKARQEPNFGENDKFDTTYQFGASNTGPGSSSSIENPFEKYKFDPKDFGPSEDFGTYTGEGTQLHHTYQNPTAHSYDTYFHHFFPDYSTNSGGGSNLNVQSSGDGNKDQESKTHETKLKDGNKPDFAYLSPPDSFYVDPPQKKQLEEAIGAFSQKDRSQCKKVQREKMTCYQCIDKTGMQHEECMFVATTEPKSHHLAYHQVKEFRLVPEDKKKDNSGATTTTLDKSVQPKDSTSSSTNTDKKTKTDVTYASLTTKNDQQLKTAAASISPLKLRRRSSFITSTTSTTTTSSTTPTSLDEEKTKKKKKKATAATAATMKSEVKGIVQASSSNVSPQIVSASEYKTSSGNAQSIPDHLKIDGPGGLYTAETQMKFDKTLKITLPEYMLKISPHEESFDEFVKSSV